MSWGERYVTVELTLDDWERCRKILDHPAYVMSHGYGRTEAEEHGSPVVIRADWYGVPCPACGSTDTISNEEEDLSRDFVCRNCGAQGFSNWGCREPHLHLMFRRPCNCNRGAR